MSKQHSKCFIALWKIYNSIRNWRQTREDLMQRHYLRKLKDSHKGEPCVIVGNGPSLRAEDLSTLHALHIPTLACNRIHLIFSQTPWRPTYYFMSDEKLIQQYSDDVEGVPPERRFFPKRYKDQIRNGRFYNTLPVDYEREGKFSYDAIDGVYQGCSITTEMIQFAFFMGFSEIYLIGVDFSYSVTNKRDDVTYTYSGENNYFIPGYLKPGEVADMPNVNANLLAFQAAKDAIEAKGRVIRNSTRGGKLEVFQRVNLDDLMISWEQKANCK